MFQICFNVCLLYLKTYCLLDLLRELTIIAACMVDALPFLFPHAPDFAADRDYCVCVAFVLLGMKVLYTQVVNVIRHYKEIAHALS